jgi:5-methylcytosine-specific restriction protein A
MTSIPKPCLDCGDLSSESRCEVHTATRTQAEQKQRDRDRDRLSPRERGYDTQWRRLSERARRLQPWCSDCGAIEDLSADHKPKAWQRKAQGKALRLCDVDVLCNGCNSRRESSRPGTKRAQAVA